MSLQVIRSLLVSLAHEEAYYSLFNEFIRQHPSVLEEDGFSFLKHCMALLSFENKQAWFKRKLDKLRYSGLGLGIFERVAAFSAQRCISNIGR